MWAQTLNKDEGSYKNATKRKLMSLWQNYKPRNGFTDALKELERVGLLSRIHSRYNGNYCGCVYRFATYADIEKFCKRIKKGKAATKVNVTDEAEAEE